MPKDLPVPVVLALVKLLPMFGLIADLPSTRNTISASGKNFMPVTVAVLGGHGVAIAPAA